MRVLNEDIAMKTKQDDIPAKKFENSFLILRRRLGPVMDKLLFLERREEVLVYHETVVKGESSW